MTEAERLDHARGLYRHAARTADPPAAERLTRNALVVLGVAEPWARQLARQARDLESMPRPSSRIEASGRPE
jgi:hypothetical protein